MPGPGEYDVLGAKQSKSKMRKKTIIIDKSAIIEGSESQAPTFQHLDSRIRFNQTIEGKLNTSIYQFFLFREKS
jgi:hypothetical protein